MMDTGELSLVSSAVVATAVALLVVLQRLGIIGPPAPGSKGAHRLEAKAGLPYRSLPPPAHRPPEQAPPAPSMQVTGRHDLDGSLGKMRCDGHGELVAGQVGAVTELRELRREIRDGFETIGERLDKLGEWKGGADARLAAAERELGRLNSGPTRGGAAAHGGRG
ncbi:MAG: hypothetical protein WC700_10335 [Gemmatimonadaceae bacterium]|jgi:hypothetical protein